MTITLAEPTPVGSTPHDTPVTTRVVVLSPHEITRAGLRSLIDQEPDVELVAATRLETARDDGSAVPGHPSWVALFDLSVLDDARTQTLSWLAARSSVSVLVLTATGHPDDTDRALAAGADGCLPMASSRPEILAAVRAARSNRLRGDGSRGSVDYTLNPAPRDTSVLTLSAREVDVLDLIGQGLSNRQLAQRLYLSENTIKTYIRTAYRKIDVTSRAQAVSWCIHNRITHLARCRAASA